MPSRLARLVANLRLNLGAGTPLDRHLQRAGRVAGWVRADLDLLAALYGTDKFGDHDYTPVYDSLMRAHRGRRVRLLEVGVGGWKASLGGASLRMWESYFRRGRIYAIDVEDKTELTAGRVQVFQCSQIDGARLGAIAREHGPFDFIVDDGSHINAHQIRTFGLLWPHLKDGGTYIVEDVQTSYWPHYGGGSLGTPGYESSCMRWFKELADSVNLPEFLDPAPPGRLDPGIASIAFHHNLIVLTKDLSARYSNFDLENPELRRTLLSPAD